MYSNRAACYTKLMEFRYAVEDCDKCIKLDPKFVKGHIRKGLALNALHDNNRALRSFEEALRLDPNSSVSFFECGVVVSAFATHRTATVRFPAATFFFRVYVTCDLLAGLDFSFLQEALDGIRAASAACDQDPSKAKERAINDPEIQAILADPAMRLILEQMTQDPKAVRE